MTSDSHHQKARVRQYLPWIARSLFSFKTDRMNHTLLTKRETSIVFRSEQCSKGGPIYYQSIPEVQHSNWYVIEYICIACPELQVEPGQEARCLDKGDSRQHSCDVSCDFKNGYYHVIDDPETGDEYTVSCHDGAWSNQHGGTSFRCEKGIVLLHATARVSVWFSMPQKSVRSL